MQGKQPPQKIENEINILLLIDHFHVSVLLNPKLADNDVVDAAGGVCPGVCFIISAQVKNQQVKHIIS